MDQATHSKIVSFIWGIADDVLRDLFKRGKYPDVILPMCVIRRMDAVLEPTKRKVLDTKKMLDEAGITEQRAALCDAAGQAFYNTSKFTLRDLKFRGSQQQLLADFEDYLNGFSPNVQDILDNFKFRNQLPTLSKADAIGTLINKFLDPDIDLSPAGIDNHSMGTVFEELVRKFNEENNEEAGEHWTPRDAVRLMANLVLLPIKGKIKSGTYLLYDCACGTGGMLTVGEETLTEIGAQRAQQVKSLLYGQEINPETYAVCKADLLLKGEGESADHKRTCSLVRDGTHLPPARTPTGFPLLSVRNMVGGRLIRRPDDSFISKADFEQLNSSFAVRPNDVLMAIVGATLGKVAVVDDIGPFQIQRSVSILRPRSELMSHAFLAAFLGSPRLQQHLWQSVAFSARPGIYLGFVANIPVPVPPNRYDGSMLGCEPAHRH